MGTIYTVCGQKGGVGKTITAWQLAALHAEKGRNVLLIDLDEQANLTDVTQTAPEETEDADLLPCSRQLFRRSTETVKQCGIRDAGGIDQNFSVIPGHRILSTVEAEESAELPESFKRLWMWAYDVIIIDTPREINPATIAALFVADRILITCVPAPFSVRGVDDMLLNLRAANLTHKILGIIPTRCKPRSSLYGAMIDVMREKWGSLLTNSTIRECQALEDSVAFFRPVIYSAPKSHGAEDYRALFEELEERNKHAEEWEEIARLFNN